MRRTSSAIAVSPRVSSSSRQAINPASLMTFAPWNSSFPLVSNVTRKASVPLSPIGFSNSSCVRHLAFDCLRGEPTGNDAKTRRHRFKFYRRLTQPSRRLSRGCRDNRICASGRFREPSCRTRAIKNAVFKTRGSIWRELGNRRSSGRQACPANENFLAPLEPTW